VLVGQKTSLWGREPNRASRSLPAHGGRFVHGSIPLSTIQQTDEGGPMSGAYPTRHAPNFEAKSNMSSETTSKSPGLAASASSVSVLVRPMDEARPQSELACRP
jgi:hypothetical protein